MLSVVTGILFGHIALFSSKVLIMFGMSSFVAGVRYMSKDLFVLGALLFKLHFSIILQNIINQFVPNTLFLYSLKTSENLTVSDIFRA